MVLIGTSMEKYEEVFSEKREIKKNEYKFFDLLKFTIKSKKKGLDQYLPI